MLCFANSDGFSAMTSRKITYQVAKLHIFPKMAKQFKQNLPILLTD